MALAFAVAPCAAKAEICKASYYAYGSHTASGERFIANGLTAAHRTHRFGTQLQVCLNQRCTVVKVNDRGPAAYTGRCIDLSRGAAIAIGLISRGIGLVNIKRLE